MRISKWAKQMGIEVEDIKGTMGLYRVKDIFTTVDGSWEPGDQKPYSIPEWAVTDYHKQAFDDAGGATHLFAAVEGEGGKLLPNHPVYYSSDGWATSSIQHTKARSGWANLFMAGSSAFYPADGQRGPWAWYPLHAAQQVTGGGLPMGHHISTFVVWTLAEDEQPDPVEPTDPDDLCNAAQVLQSLTVIEGEIVKIRQAITLPEA